MTPRALILAVAISLFTLSASAAPPTAAADALLFGKGRPPNPVEARKIYEPLAQSGNAVAHDRLGFIYFHGRGTTADPVRAAMHYARAVELGRTHARVNLGRSQMAAGQGANALETLSLAQAEGSEAASLWLAIGHIDQSFGSRSNPKKGRADLLALANAGNADAADHVLRRAAKGIKFPGPLATAANAVYRAAKGGDSDSAVAFAAFLREHGRRVANADAMYADLVAGGYIDPQSRAGSVEKLHYIAKTQPGQAGWEASYDALRNLDASSYAHALAQMSWINSKAYIFVLQSELSRLGRANSKPTGRLDTPTRANLVKFCKDIGIRANCRGKITKNGPAKALAQALSNMQ